MRKASLALTLSLMLAAIAGAQVSTTSTPTIVTNATGWTVDLNPGAALWDPNGSAASNIVGWYPYLQISTDPGFAVPVALWEGSGWASPTTYSCAGVIPATFPRYYLDIARGIACGADAAVGIAQSATGLTPGETYYARLWMCLGEDTTGDCGSVPEAYALYLGGSVAWTTPELPPTVTTLAATSVTASTATLNGSVNANNIATTWWFEWGETLGYELGTLPGSTIAAGVGPTSWTPQAVSVAATGLLAGHTYHFRVVADNGIGGTVPGSDMTFVALPLPDVATGAATSITASQAILNGTVTPNGVGTNWWFRWGTVSGSYPFVTAGGYVPAGAASTAVSVTISGLTSGDRYYYTIAGASVNGTAEGAEAYFDTVTVGGPTAVTLGPLSITSDGAVLRGTYDTNGSSGTAWFEWGSSPALGHQTAAIAANSSSAVAYSIAIDDLEPDTDYYVRAVVQAGTIAYGDVVQFHTAAEAVQYTDFDSYKCSWLTVQHANMIGGSGRRGLARKSTASKTWSGTGIRVYSIRDKTLGKMRITLDGNDVSTVNLHTSGATEYQVLVYEALGLAAGPHTISVQSAAKGKRAKVGIFVDALEVLQ